MVQMVVSWISCETLVTYQYWGCFLSQFGVGYLGKINPDFLDTGIAERSFGFPG
jgi:hypothetical protein